MPSLTPINVARRHLQAAPDRAIALMKFLSGVANHLGVGRHIYVVGGAVRNFLMGLPAKDVDVVVDSVALGGRKDSAWFAQQVARSIPAQTDLTTNQYGVAILTIKGDWELEGQSMQGEVIEIANARKESYGGGAGKGYKPHMVEPATIEEDVERREFTFNCMAGDTLIPTEHGILRIDEIASREDGDQQDIKVQVAGREGTSLAVGWQYSGFTDTLRVTTGWGHHFTCTHHHPVLVLRGHDHEWVQADQLEVGDLLCVPVQKMIRQNSLPLNLPDPVQPKRGKIKEVLRPLQMTPELAFVLGCLVAEGSNTDKRVSFSNSDPAFISRYSECFHAVFGFMPSRNRVVEQGTVRNLNGVDFVASRDGYDIYADSKTVVSWLDHMGLYCGGSVEGLSASHHKVIPWAILEADEQSQCAFIAAYLEGDGSIRPDSGRMVFRSVSPHIRHQLQVLLGAHGILSKVDGEFVHINAVDAEILWPKIKPWMITKGFDYDAVVFKSRNRYGIPCEHLTGFLKGRRGRSCGRAGVSYHTDTGDTVTLRGIGQSLHNIQRFLYDAHRRGDFAILLEGLSQLSPVEHGRFQRLLDLGYQYVEVASVEDAGQQDVYDISMQAGVEPAFVANGVIVHNTLLWRLMDLTHGPEKAEVIDLTGCGIKDLEKGELRCPRDPDVVFSDDPTRIIRAIKFVSKYGFKIPPDLAVAIKRNAHRMKSAPWEAIGTILVRDVLNTPAARKSLKLMVDLGLMDVIGEMLRENKPFATYLKGELNDRQLDLLLDLADLGLPVQSPVTFLTREQQNRLREITMDKEPAWAKDFLTRLKQPPVDNMGLINSLKLPPRERGQIATVAREVMLAEPEMAFDPEGLTTAVEGRLSKVFRSKVAIDVNDPLQVIDFVRGYKQISGVRRIPIARATDPKTKETLVLVGNEQIDQYNARIRGKDYLSDSEMDRLFSSEVVIEEKVDGHPVVILYGGHTFFCESLSIRHTVSYDNVPYSEDGWPDMTVVYEIMDGEEPPPYTKGQGNGKWLSRSEKEALCRLVGAPLVPLVFKGKLTPEKLPPLADRLSSFGSGSAEGIVVKNLHTGVFGKFINLEFQRAISDESLWGGVHPEIRRIKNLRRQAGSYQPGEYVKFKKPPSMSSAAVFLVKTVEGDQVGLAPATVWENDRVVRIAPANTLLRVKPGYSDLLGYSYYNSALALVARLKSPDIRRSDIQSAIRRAVSLRGAPPEVLKLVEEMVWEGTHGGKIAKQDLIPGGLAKGKSPQDFDPKELGMGIEVEREHLVGGGYSEDEMRSRAQEIAMDHLTEIPDYYTRLKKMESGAEKQASFVASRWLRHPLSKRAASTGKGTSVGLFIPLPPELAALYPKLSEDTSPPHVTLLYVGKVTSGQEDAFLNTVAMVLNEEPGPVRAWTAGDYDKFVHPAEDRTVFYTPVQFSKPLGTLRDKITLALKQAGFEVENSFPLAFNPHVTLEYRDGIDPEMQYEGEVPDVAWEFHSVEVWGLPQKHTVDLGEFDVAFKTMGDLTRPSEDDLRDHWGPFLA